MTNVSNHIPSLHITFLHYKETKIIPQITSSEIIQTLNSLLIASVHSTQFLIQERTSLAINSILFLHSSALHHNHPTLFSSHILVSMLPSTVMSTPRYLKRLTSSKSSLFKLIVKLSCSVSSPYCISLPYICAQKLSPFFF